jgi:hypothetical protein
MRGEPQSGWRKKWLSVTIALGLLASAAVQAQIYRWTDERGVVHFAQAPPPSATGVVLWSARAPVARPPAAAVPVPPGDGGTRPSPPPLSARARVELLRHKTSRLNAKLQDFSGAVKNSGDRTATDVAVIVSVRDDQTTGNCFETRIPVTPSRLAPGEEGTFSGQHTDPCFFGDIHVDMQPRWRDG